MVMKVIFIPYGINIIEDNQLSFIRDQIRGIRFAKITRDHNNTGGVGFGIKQNVNGDFIIKNVEEDGPADFADVLVNDKLVVCKVSILKVKHMKKSLKFLNNTKSQNI